MVILKRLLILIIFFISFNSIGQNERNTSTNNWQNMNYGIYDLEILGNDEAIDLYTNFFYLYDDGEKLKKIKEEVELEWIANPEDILFKELCLAAYVKAMWEINKPDKKFTTELQEMYENEATKEIWENLEKGLWVKRKKVLQKFLDEIDNPIKKIRQRDLAPSLKENIFELGDVISIKLDNNSYGCIIVCALYPERGVYEYTFNVVDYYDINPPELDSIILNNCVYQVQTKLPGTTLPPNGFALSFNQSLIEKKRENFIKIGNYKYSKEFQNSLYSGGSKWEDISEYFPFEKNQLFELDEPENGRIANAFFKVPISKL